MQNTGILHPMSHAAKHAARNRTVGARGNAYPIVGTRIDRLGEAWCHLGLTSSMTLRRVGKRAEAYTRLRLPHSPWIN